MRYLAAALALASLLPLEAAAKPDPPPAALKVPPNKVAEVDILRVRLALAERRTLENLLAAAQLQLRDKTEEHRRLVEGLKAQYRIGPDDHLDEDTLEIKRGKKQP